MITESTISVPQSKEKENALKTATIMGEMVFLFLLASTILPPAYLWVARISWILLAVYFAKNIDYGLCALFFYAAFFSSSGFAKGLFFTLKHFHIAFFITLTTHLIIHPDFRSCLKGGAKKQWGVLKPFLLMLLVSILPIGKSFPSNSTWLLLSNLLLTMFCFFYLQSLLFVSPTPLAKLLTYFLIGTSLSVLYGMCYDYFVHDPLNYHVLHNKHLAVEVASCLFFALSLFFLTQNKLSKTFYFFILIILFSALILTCGRTAWISTILSTILFFNFTYKHSQKRSLCIHQKYFLVLLFSTLAILVFFGFHSELIASRYKEIPLLWSLDYWHHTLSDQQNFGFFGIFRLRQVYELWSILKTNPLLGRGFSRDIMGFHGLYFSILGGGGIVGFSFLVQFIRNLLHKTIQAVNQASDLNHFYLSLATLCSLSSWLLCSFMQTLILQFSVWIPIICAIHLSSTTSSEISRAEP